MSRRKKKRTTPQENGDRTLIYIVDDEAMLLELASLILKPLGYDIQTFREPGRALQSFTESRHRPALLITDYSMHGMDGLSLIDACRRLEPQQKTLLISGTVGAEISEQVQVKPDRFLAKPYQAKELAEVVQALLAE